MGSYWSSEYVSKQELIDIIDKNKDKTISREEFNNFMRENQDYKKKYENLLIDYEVLKRDKTNNVVRDVVRNDEKNNSYYSLENVKEYVENEIMKTEANSKYIPDVIEKKAYVSIYKAILEALCQLSNSTELTLLNHKITINLEPV